MSKILLQDSFKEFCELNQFEVNVQQVKIINSIEKFLDNRETILKRIIKKKEKLCFYLYGEVGVGKTMLLNFAFDRLNIRKHRQHFNEFMINFHNFRHKKKDNNTITAFVKELKKKYDLIYLDEFQVTNIVDAMILGKLFEVIFEEKIKIIITTNTKLHDLYKDGLQRDQFLPFISIIENFYSGVAKLNFQDLCDKNLGAEDYINIAKMCNHIFIEKIPKFNNENSNQQLRFITMIDIFYEKKIRLTLSIEENLNNLSSSNKHFEVFKRTVSRMFEMTKSP